MKKTVPADTGVLYCEDNLRQLTQIPDESIDLIYLDPPFFSNRNYEVIWGDEAEVRSFEDRWDGGMQVYITWMRDRVRALHRVLRPTGSLYLHCDPHASHYLKVMADELFGEGNFRNEIIWRRTGAHGKSRRFAPIHDVILFYTKSGDYVWNRPKRPYMLGHVKEYFAKDAQGWRTNYYGNVLTGSGRRGGLSGQPWRGIDPTAKGRHWAIPRALLDEIDEDLSQLNQHEKLDRLYELGLIRIEPGAAWPIYQHYITPEDGTPAPDIWAYQPYSEGTVFGTQDGIDADVRWLSTRDRERLGYPTQKPEDLLRRIIAASSNPGQVVLDPFCGCGTTVSVAEQLNREWIGIDISPTAVNIMANRLRKVSRGQCAPKIIGLPITEEDLKKLKPFEFQNWVIQKLWGTHAPRKSGDMGIDGYSFMVNDPIQVKQSERVGRNVVDNFETAMDRAGKDRGYIVAFSFTKGAKEEVARVRWHRRLDIQLVTVRELLEPDTERWSPFTPQVASVTELPLPQSRPRSARPTAAELIRSDQAATSDGASG
ncbi:DNA methyltransferase [Streptomyces sp. NPDC054866]